MARFLMAVAVCCCARAAGAQNQVQVLPAPDSTPRNIEPARKATAPNQLPAPGSIRLPAIPENVSALQSAPGAAEIVQPQSEKLLDLVEFKDLLMGEAARILSDQAGLKIVPSAEAAKVIVSLYLRDVTPMVALDALTKANGLFYRQDPGSEIIRIYTIKEYESDLGSFREEETQVFTLFYPNPVDVAVAIRDVYGDRVRLSLGIGDMTIYQDLIQRFIRYNLVANQNQQGFSGTGIGAGGTSGGGGLGVGGGIGGFGGGTSGMGGGLMGMGGMGGGMMGMGGLGGGMMGMGGGMSGMGGGFGQAGQQNQEPQPVQPLEDLNAEQIQALVKARGDLTSDEGRAAIDDLLRRQRSRIYISVIRRNNQLVVRTSDHQTIKRIRELVQRLDVPTPLVLLEVKVLSLDLGDDFTSAFDYQFANAGTAGEFTSGDILPPAAGSGSIAPTGGGLIAGGPALVPGATFLANRSQQMIFQYVSNTFRVRLQLLENDHRVTELATPMLLTANNEVSRIFIGTYTPIVTGYSQSGAITGGNTTTAVQPTPQTTVEAIGQGLLITPNINADRTVTLRISQQNSQLGAPATIPLTTTSTNGTTGITNVSVATVQTNLVTGTIVAKDGLTVALGGLISEEAADTRAEVPVLGKLPIIGFFFRNQETLRTRTETIILIRPYIFNTPAESAALSADLIPDNSLHPKAVNPVGSLNSFGSQEVVRPNPPKNALQTIFRFHSIDPMVY